MEHGSVLSSKNWKHWIKECRRWSTELEDSLSILFMRIWSILVISSWINSIWKEIIHGSGAFYISDLISFNTPPETMLVTVLLCLASVTEQSHNKDTRDEMTTDKISLRVWAQKESRDAVHEDGP